VKTLLGVLLAHLTLLALAAHAAEAPRRPVPGVVVRVLDGETLEVLVGDRLETVRHIGIRTLLIEHPVTGSERYRHWATAVHARLVEGEDVILQPGIAARDAAGRLLASVRVHGRLVSAELVRSGFAEVMTTPPNVGDRGVLLALQARAQADRAGFWADADVYRLYRPARSGVLASPRTLSFFHVDDEKSGLEERLESFESPEAAIRAGYVPSFDYRIHEERDWRTRVVVTVPGAPVPAAVRAAVLQPSPAAPRHTWRGGVFVPVN